jgi:hypothetical protein
MSDSAAICTLKNFLSHVEDKEIQSVLEFALKFGRIAHYGRSLGLSPRRDLGANYVRLTAEIALFTEDGANIMIDNGWLEQPPHATDRDQLTNG